ncbi:MAG: 5-formyltetrahydrofolate cyclo-ligase [Spirochaetota bacterium]
MYGSSNAKRRLRSTMGRSVKALSDDERSSRSALIRESLMALREWRDASIVLLYHAMPDEVDTHDLIIAALRGGKRVYLPRVAAGVMGFHHLTDEAALTRLARHPYGMLEPDGSERAWDAVDTLEPLVVCPGRAFDLAGNRLGRGGAFYDRFLQQLRHGVVRAGTAIGICFDLQIVDAVPVTVRDEPVDAVVTERRVVRV